MPVLARICIHLSPINYLHTMKNYYWMGALFITILFCHCNQQQETVKPKAVTKNIVRKKPAADITYHYENGKTWSATHETDAAFKRIVTTVNRADIRNIAAMDSIIVPSDSVADMAYYLPFPVSVGSIKPIDKIIFFSYATQSFAAYENGEMVYTGATNMGRKKDPTPVGLFFTNWKAETTTSTFNDEWELKWNFNIENKLGVGWHQYQMPGYPASHSCLRLMEEDARYLYTWADQWRLNKKEEIISQGTPVIVFGSYPFDGVKPWAAIVTNGHALDIAEATIDSVIAPHLQKIMAEQERRNNADQTDL